MECHRCAHAAAVAAGKYRRRAYEESPCAKCELVERSDHTLAYDDERPGVAGAEGLQGPTDAPEPEEDGLVPISVMSAAVAVLLRLPAPVRDVVCWRFQGVGYREIALRQSVTIGAVENRHRRAMQKWPELRALFAEKAAKQRRRRPAGAG